ncbi:MAG TPA: dethiobiotin synthase [Candidatus Anammoximicrobium sp.]|nr:dethiobiotin synthase [Candidatus Anammoximicrobium sp.]
MTVRTVPGLFITGTDTGVGKTRVAACIARTFAGSGLRVGVYKPVASGCRRVAGELISEDAVELWEAAGRPGELSEVCPQRFAAPLAPPLAARAEGRAVDVTRLRYGLEYWRRRADLVLVEGAGGLLSPLTETEFVADLAADFGFPLLVVAANALGVINQTLQTLIVASVFRGGLEVAGVVLNHPRPPSPHDLSLATNRAELERRSGAPILAELAWQAESFDRAVYWQELAREGKRNPAVLEKPGL